MREIDQCSRLLPAFDLDEPLKKLLFGLKDADLPDIWQQVIGLDLIEAYGSDLKDFLKRELLGQIVFWFGEELKSDNKQSNKAWRAFQRMLLEGIYEGVRSIQENQEFVRQDLARLDHLSVQLDQLQNMVDARLPNEAFQQELVDALNKNQTYMEVMAENTRQIRNDVETLRSEVRKITIGPEGKIVNKAQLQLQLSEIRQRLLLTGSKPELNRLLYAVEELLEHNAYDAEARLLKEQIETAIRRAEVSFAPAAAHRAQFKTRSLLAALSGLIVATSLFASAVYLRFQTRSESMSNPAVVSDSKSSIRQRLQVMDYWQRRIEMNKAYWTPRLREAFDRSNQALDGAIEQTLQDLRRNPHDEFSEEMLNELLNDKLALLREFADFDGSRRAMLYNQLTPFALYTDLYFTYLQVRRPPEQIPAAFNVVAPHCQKKEMKTPCGRFTTGN